jgi:hypothetical protein
MHGFIEQALTLFDFHHQAIHVQDRIQAFQWSILPLPHRVHDRFSDIGDGLRRDFHPIPFQDLSGNIARREAVSREPEDFVIEAGQACLIFLDQQRIEAAFPITRDGDFHGPLLAFERLLGVSIAMVRFLFFCTGMLFIAQMSGQLCLQAALDQHLTQLLDHPIRSKKLFSRRRRGASLQQFIQQLWPIGRVLMPARF